MTIKTIFLATAMIGAGAVSALAEDMDMGQSAYMQFCATCHGASGKADGPMTQLMTSTVSDLTQLSKNNDGVFPMLDVIHVIDGRTGVRGHGGPMPVYGALFAEEGEDMGPYGGAIYSRARILSLAYYLEKLQD